MGHNVDFFDCGVQEIQLGGVLPDIRTNNSEEGGHPRAVIPSSRR